MAPTATDTEWDHEYHTLRRERLFRNPPQDRTAYPALQEAISPHIESFNAVFGGGRSPGLIHHGLVDIGIKTFLDGDPSLGPVGRNDLRIRYRDVTLEKPQLPPTNKFAVNRDIYPAECRERHTTYRGRLLATFEYSISGGDWKEYQLDMGQLPIMVKVRTSATMLLPDKIADECDSQTVAISRTTRQLCW
jgi:DNA-directed RNA polymerase I subunit RPA2